jgi:hypothetical protein
MLRNMVEFVKKVLDGWNPDEVVGRGDPVVKYSRP